VAESDVGLALLNKSRHIRYSSARLQAWALRPDV
jgi:hypothetical protein